RFGQPRHLEVQRLDQVGVLGVVGLQRVDVLVAAAVGGEQELLAVRRPGHAVVEGGRVGQPPGLAAAVGGHQPDRAVYDEGDVPLVGGQAILGAAGGEGVRLLGVALVVGVDLDGQAARRGAVPGGGHSQVAAA